MNKIELSLPALETLTTIPPVIAARFLTGRQPRPWFIVDSGRVFILEASGQNRNFEKISLSLTAT